MLKYPCLVLDHDDTVVRSEETVNYPSFCKALEELRPGTPLSLREFSLWTCREGFFEMCVNHFEFQETDFKRQFEIWLNEVMRHMPPAFPGMDRILKKHRERGGLICVVSHSSTENIIRDYLAHFGFAPDRIYDGELGEEKRKPSPWPLDDIMEHYGLSSRELLVVDDMMPGCQMAQKRNVDFAWAGWYRQTAPEITDMMERHCDYSFRTTEEFEKFLFPNLTSVL